MRALDIDLDAVLASVVSYSKDWLRAHGEMYSMFHAFGPQGTMILGTPWEDEKAKREVLHILRLMFAAYNVVAYVQVSEAWTTFLEGEEAYKAHLRSGKVASDYANKKETLIATIVTHDRKEIQCFDYVRDENGKLVDFVFDKQGLHKLEGRMLELLPAAGKVVSYHEKLLAKKFREKLEVKWKRKEDK